MSEPPRLESTLLMIELRVGAEPIEGVLRVGHGEAREFRGWLQLTRFLEAATQREDGGGVDASKEHGHQVEGG